MLKSGLVVELRDLLGTQTQKPPDLPARNPEAADGAALSLAAECRRNVLLFYFSLIPIFSIMVRRYKKIIADYLPLAEYIKKSIIVPKLPNE